MNDFCLTLSKDFNIKIPVIMKRNPMLQMKQVEILSDFPNKKLNELRVNEGVNLYLEDSSLAYPLDSLQGEIKQIV